MYLLENCFNKQFKGACILHVHLYAYTHVAYLCKNIQVFGNDWFWEGQLGPSGGIFTLTVCPFKYVSF